MHFRTPSRRHAAALASACAILLAALGSGTPASAADEAPSTPVDVTLTPGATYSYVVNAKHANPGQTRLAERAVKDAGGVVVQSWPETGVVIAHSTDADFRTAVKAEAKGHAVESVGLTRTVPVSEATPDGTAGTTTSTATARSARAATYDQEVSGSTLEAVAADPLETEQWDMRLIKADQAHEITDGSPDVVVGVLDSGIDPEHVDLAPNIDVANSVNCTAAGRVDTSPTGWYITTSYHGTHVAGTIAAARNGTGIVGVAPGVKIASVKVVNDDGFIYPEYAICGFMWAGLRGLDVTNNSYYIDPFEHWCGDQPDQAAVQEAVRRAVDFSIDEGVVSAVAAGNAATDLSNNTSSSSSPNDSTPVERVLNSSCTNMPAELEGIVTVSSIDRASNLSSFSNRGLGVVEVAAPGSSILSTYPGNRYATASGTSMASPHVAGVLALLKSAHPDWTPAELVTAVQAQADDHACPTSGNCVGTPENNSYYGEGVVDALEAVASGSGQRR